MASTGDVVVHFADQNIQSDGRVRLTQSFDDFVFPILSVNEQSLDDLDGLVHQKPMPRRQVVDFYGEDFAHPCMM